MTCKFQITDGVLVAAVNTLKHSQPVCHTAQTHFITIRHLQHSKAGVYNKSSRKMHNLTLKTSKLGITISISFCLIYYIIKVFSVLANVETFTNTFTLFSFLFFLDIVYEVYIITVSGGRRPRTSIRALCICSAVPSKNLPQPATNRVSPALERKRALRSHDRGLPY